MAEIFAAELGTDAGVLGDIDYFLFKFDVAKGLAVGVACGWQAVEVMGARQFHCLQGHFRRCAADDDGQMIGRTGRSAQGTDFLINEFQQVYKLNREIHWYNAYGEDLPFRDHYFDIVICSNSLDHVEDNHKTISEINRVLKHEGKLLLTVDIFNEKVKRDDKHPYAFMDEDIPKLIWNYNILFFKKSQTNANLYEYMKCQNLQKNEITKPDSKDNLNIPGKKGEVTFSEVVIVAEKI